MNVHAHTNEEVTITTFFNSHKMHFDQPPIIINNVIMMPVRAISETVGATIFWNNDTHQLVVIINTYAQVLLTIGNNLIYINDVPHLLCTPPLIVQKTGRALVPLQFFEKVFEITATWDYATTTLILTTDEPTLPWSSREDAIGGLTVGNYPFDPMASMYSWDWHHKYRRQIVGNSYFNTRGWRMSEYSYKEMLTKRDMILAQIITDNMSEFDKLRAVHGWLAKNVSYNTDAWSWWRFDIYGNGWNPNWTPVRYEHEHQMAWSALVLQTTVCAGYADAFLYLLEPLGIEIQFIYGTVTVLNGINSMHHAWNIVQLDGLWYHIDVSWSRFYSGEQPIVIYDWFLLSDHTMQSRGRYTRYWDANAFPAAFLDYQWNRPRLAFDFTHQRWHLE